MNNTEQKQSQLSSIYTIHSHFEEVYLMMPAILILNTALDNMLEKDDRKIELRANKMQFFFLPFVSVSDTAIQALVLIILQSHHVSKFW